MSQRRNLLMPKDRESVFIHRAGVCQFTLPVRLLGVLKSLPGALLAGLVILLLMGFRGTTMSVGGGVV
jgi:hypothetical protein